MRVGGEEFLILGMRVSKQEAENMIEKIRKKQMAHAVRE